MHTLYGIENCDTVRKARRWLEERELPFRFHDLRRDGVTPALLQTWADESGWEALLNRRSATWRGLSREQRESLDGTAALALMLAHPTLIRRPILEREGEILIGFDAQRWCEALT